MKYLQICNYIYVWYYNLNFINLLIFKKYTYVSFNQEVSQNRVNYVNDPIFQKFKYSNI